jgi:hypothetical protein
LSSNQKRAVVEVGNVLMLLKKPQIDLKGNELSWTQIEVIFLFEKK